MKSMLARAALTCLLLLALTEPTPGLAQDDNTGTNPANFTYDARFITEIAEFESGGGSLITNTFSLSWPLGRNIANLRGDKKGSFFYDMGQKASLRFRARYQHLSIDTPGAAPFGTSEVSGIGDFDARLLYLAHTSRKLIVATGLEAFFDTASNEALGSGKTLLGPVVFTVLPGILGGSSLFAPGLQYVFDVDGDGPDVSRSQLDLYLVWLLAGGKNWLIVDPQIVFDHENNTEPALIEVEWGFMIAPSAGASGYLRPGVGLGSSKLYSWNLEVGLKFVWR
jgi:hypothetical protein